MVGVSLGYDMEPRGVRGSKWLKDDREVYSEYFGSLEVGKFHTHTLNGAVVRNAFPLR